MRKFTALTLLALLLNVVLPFYAVYDPALLQQVQADSPRNVLLCTENGLEWVSIEDVQSGKEHPKPHPQYKCGLCVLAAIGLNTAFAPAEVVVVYQPSRLLIGKVTPQRSSDSLQHFRATVSSRAPPVYS